MAADDGAQDALGGARPPDTLASDRATGGTVQGRPASACAACGRSGATHRLRLVTDWVDHLTEHSSFERGGGPFLAPLCEWCHSWAQVLELAELARPSLRRPERIRLVQQRNRFLDALDPDLVSDVTDP